MAMDAEERMHLTELRRMYLIRLRVLEVHKARDGYETKPSVLMEIEEIQQKIIEINQILDSNLSTLKSNETGFSPPASSMSYLEADSKELLQIELSMDYNMWNPDLQRSVVRVLAALMNISPETVKVTQLQRGSVIMWIEVPEDAAERLLAMYVSEEPALREIGVKTIIKPKNVEVAMMQNEVKLHSAVTLIIVGDYLMFRQGIRAALEPFQDQVTIIGEAASADDAVAIVRERAPNVVLLHLQLPQRLDIVSKALWEHGVAAIEKTAQVSPTTRVLIVSDLEEPDTLFNALRSGAYGYIIKENQFDSAGLVDIIKRTIIGEAFYGPVIARLIRTYHQQRSRDSDSPSKLLTSREKKVLDLFADHKSNLEIANELSISIKTVKTHLGSILAKLHLERQRENSTGMSIPNDKQEQAFK